MGTEWAQPGGGPHRRKAVAELTKKGLSTRQIAEVVGVHHDTVAGDQKAVGNPTDLEAEAKTKTRKQRDLKAAAKRQDRAAVGFPTDVPEPDIRHGKLTDALADVVSVERLI